MNHALAQAVDEIATRDPARLGYGYADTQHPWRHDPAFDLSRTTVVELLERIQATTDGAGTVLQVGLEERPGLALALAARARRLVAIDPSAERAAALRASAAGGSASNVEVVTGDPCDAATAAAVARTVGECDALVLDAGDYETARQVWQRLGPLVRVGGLVAIVDRSQVFAFARRAFDVDRLVVDLERDVLAPGGARCERSGGAWAVHTYVQTAATRSADAPAEPAGFVPTPRPIPLGVVRGHSLHGWHGAVVALEGTDSTLCPRRLEQNRYPTVLVAADRERAERLVDAWLSTGPEFAAARSALVHGHPERARAIVVGATTGLPWLRDALVTSLEWAPWNRALLHAQGTLALFTGREREGAALLRRALAQEMVDAEGMQTVAAAYLRVLRDEIAARDLLAEGRHRVRIRRIAELCHSRLRGSVLWQHPHVLADVRGVVQVGRHGDDPEAWGVLGIDQIMVLEGRPMLDEWIARGQVDPACYDLLCVDAEGGELDVLRGAGSLLQHVENVCATVFLQPARVTAPMPEEIQRFLREFDGGDGFALRAFEPGADPARGTALFRRIRRRRGRR